MRLETVDQIEKITGDCIPPRMWELENTSAWINFYLKRDHHSKSAELISSCSLDTCRFTDAMLQDFKKHKAD